MKNILRDAKQKPLAQDINFSLKTDCVRKVYLSTKIMLKIFGLRTWRTKKTFGYRVLHQLNIMSSQEVKLRFFIQNL